MFLYLKDSIEVNLVINRLKDKSGGVDNINVKTLKTIQVPIQKK